MKLFRRFLSKLKRRTHGDNRGNVLFTRYDVLKTKWLSIYLHEFHRGDYDRCLHDHPWHFVSIILKGGYWEDIQKRKLMMTTAGFKDWYEYTATCWRRPGSILWRPAKTAHRIELEPGVKPWSLVFVGPKVREWGFHTMKGWRPFKSHHPTEISCPGQEPRTL